MRPIEVVDIVCDMIPGVSTVTNIGVATYKAYHHFHGGEEVSAEAEPVRHYFVEKSKLHYISGFFPIVGNLVNLVAYAVQLVKAYCHKEPTSVRVLTWNIASDSDYVNVMRRKGHEVDEIGKDEIWTKRLKLFKGIFKNAIEEYQVQIFCLQEVGLQYEAISGLLEGHGFEACFDGRDSAIFWKKDDFEFVADSLAVNEKRQYSVVTLRHLQDGKTVAVASAHLTGCHPVKLVKTAPGQTEADTGNKDLEVIVEELAPRPVDGRIIGMDANVIPTHERLKTITKENIGFVRDESDDLPTNYHSLRDDCIGNICIDYIFARGDDCRVEPVEGFAPPEVDNLDANPSDHTCVMKDVRFY